MTETVGDIRTKELIERINEVRIDRHTQKARIICNLKNIFSQLVPGQYSARFQPYYDSAVEYVISLTVSDNERDNKIAVKIRLEMLGDIEEEWVPLKLVQALYNERNNFLDNILRSEVDKSRDF